MKKTLLASSIILAVLSTTAIAEDSVWTTSTSATLVSQYVFRGFDVSDEGPAIQGNFSLENSNGFYAGIWGSSYDVVSDDGIEFDLFAGYVHQINDDLSIDFGILEYTYTGDTDSSTEIHIGASFKNFTVNYHSDLDLDVDYLEANAEFEVSDKATISAHFGNASPDVGSSMTDYAFTYGYKFNDKLDGFITYSDHELDVTGAESYIFAGVNFSF